MSKNLQLHIGLLLVFMALCFEESYASSDIYLNKENEGVKVCWVIEE